MVIVCFKIVNSVGDLDKIGTITGADKLTEETAEKIWDLCNWWCWLDAGYTEGPGPKEVVKDGLTYTRTDRDRGIMNSDLVLVSEDTVMVALPVGWEKFTDVKEAVEFRLNTLPLIC